jgi:hypothetical protein
VFGKVGFESFYKFAPREHDSPSTALTLQPNVRAETCHGPLVGAAGMLLAETQMIIETEVREHNVGELELVISKWSLGISDCVNIINES